MAVHAAHRCMYLHRLVHSRNRDLLVKLVKSSCSRIFFTASMRSYEDEGQSQESLKLRPNQTESQALLIRRKRPLSPLERISSLLPQDVLSPEVMQLREQKQQEQHEEEAEKCDPAVVTGEEDLETYTGPGTAKEPKAAAFRRVEGQVYPTLLGESLLTSGELLIAEYRKNRRVEFRKMFQLQPGSRLQSSWGIIMHEDLMGQPAGRFLKTSRGVPIFIRRASLEDYVLHMKRGPAITYPKVFIPVGSKGSVLSVEVREDHHRRSVKNYERWRMSWALRREQEWPNNVEFQHADLCSSSSAHSSEGPFLLQVALDLIHPHLVLPTVLPHLHPGAVCAVYLAKKMDNTAPGKRRTWVKIRGARKKAQMGLMEVSTNEKD
ncbi:hypothetical protein XENOCAPTIV_026291 [Xenoophorus captivus]|uniref:tRNA (adenine(58)-N(1))-methyltransferase n=1 Tax=Xenoophorus captivus TaxID=1517983 RepID=A0ABV0QUB0_9TELE